MLVLEYFGEPKTHQKVVPGNTITSLSSNCYTYYQWKLNYDAGSHEVVAGDWLYGHTSHAVGKVVSLTNSDGWAGAGVGYFIIDSKVGTFQDNEHIDVVAQTTMCETNEPLTGDAQYNKDQYSFKGNQAKAALVIVFANTALVGLTGGKPDQTLLCGTPMVANSSIILRDINEIMNFKVVDYVSGTASIVQVDFFF